MNHKATPTCNQKAIDDAMVFYNQVARKCGKQKLSADEADIAYSARSPALKSFEANGSQPTVCPYASLVAQVAWYMTLSNIIANIPAEAH